MLAETSEVDAVVSDAAYALIPMLTDELVALAMSSNWPFNVIRQLQVSFDGTSLSIDYPEEIAAQVQALEYGTGTSLPNSVLRSFVYRAEPIIKDVYQNRVASNLFDLEEIYV